MLRTDKKAASQWISWVLLVALGVMISVFVLNWAKGLVTRNSEELQQRADYSSYCESTGLRIDSLCQNTQTLNMNITNNNNIKIDGITVRMIDIYGNPQPRVLNTTIRPQEKQEIKLVKQGIVKKIEVIPATHSGSRSILCINKKISTEKIPIC